MLCNSQVTDKSLKSDLVSLGMIKHVEVCVSTTGSVRPSFCVCCCCCSVTDRHFSPNTNKVNGSRVKCHLQLSSPAFPDKDDMKADCEKVCTCLSYEKMHRLMLFIAPSFFTSTPHKAILGLPWATDADVKLVSKRPVSTTAKRGTSLYNVANIIAVTSCKVSVACTLWCYYYL
jgi:hypothetical protein